VNGLGWWGWVVVRRARVLRVRLVVVVVRGEGGRMLVLPLLPSLFQEVVVVEGEGGCMGAGEGEGLLTLGFRFIIILLIMRGWEDIMGMRGEDSLGLGEGRMVIRMLLSVRGLRWIGWSMGMFMWGLRF
jgi:hypothetical protein